MPQPVRMSEAANVLRRGGIVAYPTEAVFGLGCDPANESAVLRLLALKQRPVEKGLILIAASVEQLHPYIEMIDNQHWQNVLATWPGPVTWVFPAKHAVPRWLRGAHATIAVRVTAHPAARALCESFGGAIVSTSANISTQPPARNVDDIHAQFPAGIDYLLPGEVDLSARPSEIRDALSGAVLRPG